MSLFKITAITLAAALPGLAVAQTATAPATTAPAATTAAPAATTAAPMAGMADTPAYVNLINDESITSRLREAGYENIQIARDGNKLTIDATKEGSPTNLVYDLTTGALTTVDGAGYSVESSAPGMATGDTNSQGQTDQGGADGKKADVSEPQGGTSGRDSGSGDSTPESTEPSDGGNVNN